MRDIDQCVSREPLQQTMAAEGCNDLANSGVQLPRRLGNSRPTPEMAATSSATPALAHAPAAISNKAPTGGSTREWAR